MQEQTYTWEFYIELLDANWQKFEHVGFKSDDGKFEKFMSNLPENIELPQRAKIIVKMLPLQE